MFDETFYLTKKGVLTSGTVRMTIALRYLHPTSPVQGPSHESERNQTVEENIFDIGLKENDESLKSDEKFQPEKKETEVSQDKAKVSKPIPSPNTNGEILPKSRAVVPAAAPPPPPPQKKQPPPSNGYKLPKSNSVNGPFSSLTKTAPNGKAKSLSKKDAGPRIHLSVKYNKTTSVVSLIVHKVANLQGVTHKKLPNPYVKTYILENLFSSNKRDVHSKKKTKTKNRTFNPVFEETLEYFVPQYDLQYHKLEVHNYLAIGRVKSMFFQVEVCSHRTLVSKMESLGRCLVDLRGIDKNITITNWFSLRQAVVVDRRASLPR